MASTFRFVTSGGRNIVVHNGKNPTKAIPVAGGGGGGSITSLTSVSRDVVSSAGGEALTIIGTGISGTPTVTIGGSTPTRIVYENSTTITCNAPAHATGLTDVVVGNQTLTNAIEFAPAKTSTFVSNSFETTGTLAATLSPQFLDATGGPTVTVVSTPSRSGKSIQFSTPTNTSDESAGVKFQCSNNAMLDTNNANGVWFRYWVAVDSAMISNSMLSNVGSLGNNDGQVKLSLQRYDNNGSGQPGGLMIAIGAAAGSGTPGEIRIVADDNTLPIPGSSTGVVMTDQVFVEILVNLTRHAATNTGHARAWINGKLKVDYTHVDDVNTAIGKNADVGGGTDNLFIGMGMSFTNVAGKVWIDDAFIGNGYP